MAKADSTSAAPKPSEVKTAAPKRAGRWGRIKLIVAGVILLAVIIGAQAGFIGYGYAQLKSSLFPRDEGLLEHIPGDVVGVVIVDPHQLDLAALGGEETTARTALERTRNDIKKATDIDIAFDIDKLAITPGLIVARGRFSQAKLEERLIASRYVVSEHKGVRYLVREGEDAIAVRGGVLLYGSEGSIKGSIDAESADTSLEDSEEMTRRLSQVGWDHAVLATARMSDERPSLRAILTGSTGPRAMTAGVSTKGGGLDIKVTIEAASASAAEELAKLLEEKRANPDVLKTMLGEGAAPLLADIAKATTIAADPASSTVKLRVNLDAATLDRLIKAVSAALPGNAGELYKSLRLLQLLSP